MEQKFIYEVENLFVLDSDGNAILKTTPEDARRIINETDGYLIHKPIVELIIKYNELLKKHFELKDSLISFCKNFF